VVVALSPGSFYTVTACRLFDSRASSPLTENVVYALDVFDACGIPDAVAAVALNVTAVDATANGQLLVDDVGTSSGIPAIQFRAGMARANNGVLPVSPDGLLFLMPVMGGSGNTMHVVIDVIGYFE
jgi:hypothetical protein